MNTMPILNNFELQDGQLLARRYEIMAKLGDGWEGEVYLIRKQATGIERAAKRLHRKDRMALMNGRITTFFGTSQSAPECQSIGGDV